MEVNLRAVVLDILTEIEKEGEFSHITINNALSKYQYLDRYDAHPLSVGSGEDEPFRYSKQRQQ